MNELESDWISFSQSQSGVRVFLSESERRLQGVWIQDGSVWIQHGRIQDGCNHQVESEWMRGVFLCKWWEPILASGSEFERKYYDGWIQDGQIQDSRIQDSCHHQVKWEWMSLSQIELVWISIRVEWECFWVNLREDNKVSESKMAVSRSNMAEFKMAAIIKLSQNEWVEFFVQMVGTNLGKCESVWEEILRRLNPRLPYSKGWNSIWLASSSWVRMNKWSLILQMVGREVGVNFFFVQMVDTNLGKCEWVWKKIPRWLNPRCPN